MKSERGDVNVGTASQFVIEIFKIKSYQTPHCIVDTSLKKDI